MSRAFIHSKSNFTLKVLGLTFSMMQACHHAPPRLSSSNQSAPGPHPSVSRNISAILLRHKAVFGYLQINEEPPSQD
jgi:hypothetical protein